MSQILRSDSLIFTASEHLNINRSRAENAKIKTENGERAPAEKNAPGRCNRSHEEKTGIIKDSARDQSWFPNANAKTNSYYASYNCTMNKNLSNLP